MSSILDDPTQSPYTVNMQRGEESALSSWAGPYVTEMLGRGKSTCKYSLRSLRRGFNSRFFSTTDSSLFRTC